MVPGRAYILARSLLGGLLKRVRMLAATIAVDAASVLTLLGAKIPPIAVDTGMGGAYKRGSLKSA
jgi:hypothetical protein